METIRLLVIIGEVSSLDFDIIQNTLSQEFYHLQHDIPYLKNHLHEIASGNFYIQGNKLITSSLNTESTIIVNATTNDLIALLHQISHSSSTKWQLMYAGKICVTTGDWLLKDGNFTYQSFTSILSTLPSIIHLQINGVERKVDWVNDVINLNNKNIILKFRNIDIIDVGEFGNLVNQICSKYLYNILMHTKHNVNISLTKSALSFSLSNYNVGILKGELTDVDNYKLILALSEINLPKNLSTMPSIICNNKLIANGELNSTINLFEFSKGITTLFKQFNVGSLDLHTHVETGGCNVFSIVWSEYVKKLKVIRLVYANGLNFAKIMDGIKQLSKDIIFHNIPGFPINEKTTKDTETFKVPILPIKNGKAVSSIDTSRVKPASATIGKVHLAMTPHHQKLDSSFNKMHTETKVKEIKDSHNAKKKKVPTATLR